MSRDGSLMRSWFSMAARTIAWPKTYASSDAGSGSNVKSIPLAGALPSVSSAASAMTVRSFALASVLMTFSVAVERASGGSSQCSAGDPIRRPRSRTIVLTGVALVPESVGFSGPGMCSGVDPLASTSSCPRRARRAIQIALLSARALEQILQAASLSHQWTQGPSIGSSSSSWCRHPRRIDTRIMVATIAMSSPLVESTTVMGDLLAKKSRALPPSMTAPQIMARDPAELDSMEEQIGRSRAQSDME